MQLHLIVSPIFMKQSEQITKQKQPLPDENNH